MNDESKFSWFAAIAVIVMVVILNAVIGNINKKGSANGAPDELIIEVPLSYGEPIAIAASRSGTYDKHMVTILFEGGVITIQLKYGQSYRLVYVD